MLSALVSNPAVWAQTVLFVTHDENGGFFDHLPPQTPPPGIETRLRPVYPRRGRTRVKVSNSV